MADIDKTTLVADDKAQSTITAEEMTELKEMAQEGLLFGRKKRNSNPKMRKFVYASRNGFEIFDLRQTKEKIEEAQKYLTDLVKTGQIILFVGTHAPAYNAVKEIAEKYQYPYVIQRWLGGTLTNFKTITTRLNYYLKLKSDQESGKFDKYTKKERTVLDKKIERLHRLFDGLENLKALPALVVITGADTHETAIAEARRMKIPVLAIANTSADPDTIDAVIPANDKSRSSVEYILAKLDVAIEKGIKERQVGSAKPAVKDKEKKVEKTV